MDSPVEKSWQLSLDPMQNCFCILVRRENTIILGIPKILENVLSVPAHGKTHKVLNWMLI